MVVSRDWLPGQYLVADVRGCFAGENKQADPEVAQSGRLIIGSGMAAKATAPI
jgi:hypothetical protein